MSFIKEPFTTPPIQEQKFSAHNPNIPSAIKNIESLRITLTFGSIPIPTPYYLYQDDSIPTNFKYNSGISIEGVDWTYEGIIKAFSNTKSISYHVLDNVYVGFNSAFSTTKRPFFTRTNEECQNPYELSDENSNFKGIFDLVIGFTLSSYHNFGHFNFDVFPFIENIPPGLLDNAYVVGDEIPDFQKDYFELINISMDHVLPIDEKDYLFAKRFITGIPLPCKTKHLYLAVHMRKFFVKKFNLDRKKPFRYVIIERKDHRKMKNKNFTARIKAEFKEQNWEIINRKENLKKAAEYFNEVLLMSYVAGSIASNGLFMQPESVVCPIQPTKFDPYFDVAFVGIGIHFVAVRCQDFTIKGGSNYPIPWHLVKSQIETGLRILELSKRI